MVEFAIALLSTIVGAFGGAYLGYRFAKIQASESTESKRTFLLTLLVDEFGSIPTDYPCMYHPGKVFISPIIELAALPRILDEDILDYHQHAKLLRALLDLKVATALYNSRASIVNQAQIVTAVPDPSHLQMFHVVSADYREMVKERDAVLNLLEETKMLK